jgi:branched-chain amino acid transport system substrate-binding protein
MKTKSGVHNKSFILSSLTFIAILIVLELFIYESIAGTIDKRAPVIIGLDADMSSGSAKAGEAIRRGALIAIAEINEKGGVLGGRKLKLLIKDHHGVPARSIDNIIDFAKIENLVAVLGGLHSPVIIAALPVIHEHRIIMLDPWAAATRIISNEYNPNYVFRISVRDEFAGGFLVNHAFKKGYTKLGLLLERTAWGRGNEETITEALAEKGTAPVTVQWFNWGDTDMTAQILAIENAGADAILMVANAPEGVMIVKSMAKRPKEKRLPIFSHWGITGGNFIESVDDALEKVSLQVLQTYSFIGKENNNRAKKVIKRYKEMFGIKTVREIIAPVGTAHAYDLIHILALAIEKAGTIERSRVRSALEQIPSYSGLVREYRPPFTPDWHEGLDSSDFQMAVYDSDGTIIPIK